MKGHPAIRFLGAHAPRLLVIVPLLIALSLGVWLVTRAMAQERSLRDPAGSQGRASFVPTGYVDKLRGLVMRQQICRDPATGTVVFLNSKSTNDQDFYKYSNLKQALETLNEDIKDRAEARSRGQYSLPDFRGVFAMSGTNIVLRAYPIVMPLPFSSTPVRLSPLKSGTGADWKLSSRDSVLTLVRNADPFPHSIDFWQAPPDVMASGFQLFAESKGERPIGDRMGMLTHEADGVKLDLIGERKARFFVNGEEKKDSPILLKDGDVLAAMRTDGGAGKRVVFVCHRGDNATITMASTEVFPDEPEPQFGGPEWMRWRFQSSRVALREEKLRTANFRPTMDMTLNAIVQKELEKYVAGVDRNRRPDDPIRYKPASVTLLNAATGDVLVTASYPTPATPAPANISSSTRKNRLKNQNYLSHPIGSCGKPFLAAALWQEYPDLADLEIEKPTFEDGNQIRTTAGLAMGLPYNDSSAAGYPWQARRTLDRNSFFKHSINTYFIDLFLLSLALDEQGNVKVTSQRSTSPNLRNIKYRGRFLTEELDFGKYVKNGQVSSLDEHRAIKRLGAAFDLDIGGQAETYDLKPWRYAIAHCGNQAPLPYFGIDGFSPHNANLGFDQMQSLRLDLISFLLGGGQAQWTNIKLAEAMARIVTGKKVSACVMRDDEAAPEVLDNLDLSADTLGKLRTALQGAASEGGTAKEMKPALDRWNQGIRTSGQTVRCYSKTGTWHREDKATNGPQPPDSGTYVFGITVEAPGKPPTLQIAGVVNIEDRGSSQVAVKLAANVTKALMAHYSPTQPENAP